MEKTFTIETKLHLTDELKDYLNSFSAFYSSVYRHMWHYMGSKNYKNDWSKDSYFVTHICKKYNLMKRTVNSIFRDIKGRQKAYIELKKQELNTLKSKISTIEEQIRETKVKINKIKPDVTANKIPKEKLEPYRKCKNKLFQKQRKLNRLKQKCMVLENIINEKQYKICFGSKKMLQAQYNLPENGYKTHIKWRNDFKKRRDSGFTYIGAAEETHGNQICQLIYNLDADSFCMQLRKEYNYSDKNDKYISIPDINFSYMHETIKRLCLAHQNKETGVQPLTYRFKRRGSRWYLQVMFSTEVVSYATRYDNGTIGLDYNNGFIELSETNAQGNLTWQNHYQLKYHGTGNKAKSEIRETVAKIVNIALNKGKDITIENLDFKKKKAKTLKGKDKAYNKMIHAFDYSRYTECLENACHRKQVALIKINPSYTSYIGKGKYSNQKKLNPHQAASYVIARRGQGFKDTYDKRTTA